jgi:hypothetical protein
MSIAFVHDDWKRTDRGNVEIIAGTVLAGVGLCFFVNSTLRLVNVNRRIKASAQRSGMKVTFEF